MEADTALPASTKTIKIATRTWDALKSMKKEQETFDDVIRDLLRQRTQAAGDEHLQVIRYARRTAFFKVRAFGQSFGIEADFNEVKGNRTDFTLDLAIKKVFFKRRILAPSAFFGTDNIHKHYSELFLNIYLWAVAVALKKEFRADVMMLEGDYDNIAKWRQLYHDYHLSEDSFREDVEAPLRLSEEEKPSASWKQRLKASVAGKLKTG